MDRSDLQAPFPASDRLQLYVHPVAARSYHMHLSIAVSYASTFHFHSLFGQLKKRDKTKTILLDQIDAMRLTTPSYTKVPHL